MSHHISSQVQQQNDRLLDRYILSKIAGTPSEAAKFLLEPKEYAKKHDLQLSDQVLKEIGCVGYDNIPSECISLQSRNPFMKMPVPTCELTVRGRYQPDICPVLYIT